MPAVASALRGKYPAKEIIICADNDEKGAGLEHAKDAAKFSNATVVFPLFKDSSSNPTDFNDLHQREGLNEVRRQVSGAFKGGRHVR
jgi:putative DNA primase/helicase